MPKSHFNLKRLKTPSPWIVLSSDSRYKSWIIAESEGFLKSDHLRILFFYLRKLLGRSYRKPPFSPRPRYWLTAKAKSSRMGKGKGSLDECIFPIQPGHLLVPLPVLPRFLFLRLFKSFSIRSPFNIRVLPFHLW